MCLEIIATTYRSTIFKTHVLSSYSHLCIYKVTHLQTVYLNWRQAVLKQFEVCLKMMIDWTQRYTLRPYWSEFGDAVWMRQFSIFGDILGGRRRVNLEMQSKIMIEGGWRYTWRLCSSECGGRNCTSWEILLEAVIERVWRGTWRPWSSELRYALCDRHWASLEIHLQTVIQCVWRFTWRQWSSEFGRRNRASLEMHLEVVIERVWRWTWRL